MDTEKLNYQQLQSKNLELINKEIELRIDSKKNLILNSRIENARRNVEVLFKFYSLNDKTNVEERVNSLYLDVLKENLNILKETKNIK